MPVTNDQAAADRINAMAPQQYKTYEDRMRRMARRQGLVLLKSRRRDPRAYDYCGYKIADDGKVVAGAWHNAYELSLADVEKFLTDDKRPGWRKGRDGTLRWHIPGNQNTRLCGP